MKQELLEKMLDAGFTKDEIMQLAGSAPAVQETAPETAPESVQETAPESAPESVQDNTEKRLAGIEKNIADLVKAMQLANLRNDSFDNPAESLEKRTDQAMAEIIRPPRRERG